MPATLDTTSTIPKQVLMVIANPAVSTTLGWPVGFWGSESPQIGTLAGVIGPAPGVTPADDGVLRCATLFLPLRVGSRAFAVRGVVRPRTRF